MSDKNNQEITISDLEMLRQSQQELNKIHPPSTEPNFLEIKATETLENLTSLFEMLRKNQKEIDKLQISPIEPSFQGIKITETLYSPQRIEDVIEFPMIPNEPEF